VEKDTFAAADVSPGDDPPVDLASREDALKALASAVGDDAVIVSTTGMLSRELFEHRQALGEEWSRDFLTVGGMGHASSIALGVAKQERDREVWCFDGDGALLMHLGSLAIIADHAPANYLHVVFNNGVHDSVGGQPTSIEVVDIPAVAMAAGYRHAEPSTLSQRSRRRSNGCADAGGPSLLELRVRPGNRPGIGRPTRTPARANKRSWTRCDDGGGAPRTRPLRRSHDGLRRRGDRRTRTIVQDGWEPRVLLVCGRSRSRRRGRTPSCRP
jgi:phosphonopyruvate decarboxylase